LAEELPAPQIPNALEREIAQLELRLALLRSGETIPNAKTQADAAYLPPAP